MKHAIAVCAALWLLSAPGLAGSLPKKYMPVNEVKIGMKGIGRSVFKGTKIEEFGFEVIGVLKNAFPQQSMIVIKASGQDLEDSGIVSGMSGSPCYIDGRMIGAVARTWSESKVPYGGVTPIEYMLAVSKPGPMPEAAAPADADPAPRLALADGQAVSLQPIQTPLFVSGCSDIMLDMLGERLHQYGMVPVQGGGVDVERDGEAELSAGSVLAVPMLEGDMSMAMIGTVTERVDNTIFAFGHQMYRRGPVKLPMATGYVVTVVPRLGMSFKLSAPLKTVGTITVDRQEGIVGQVGAPPRMIDVTLDVNRTDLGERTTYHVKAVDDWALTAPALEAATGGTLTAKGELPFDNTVEYKLRIECDDVKEPIVLENLVADTGTRGTLTAIMGDIVLTAAALNRNFIHRVSLRSVQLEMTVYSGRRAATIENVSLDRGRAAPGETVTITALLKPFRGECFTQDVKLKIPQDMPAGQANVEVCDSITALNRDREEQPHVYDPQTFESLISLVRLDEHRGKLFARLSTARQGVAIKGVGLPSLPGSVMGVLNFPRRAEKVTPVRTSVTSFAATRWVLAGSQRLPILIEAKTD